MTTDQAGDTGSPAYEGYEDHGRSVLVLILCLFTTRDDYLLRLHYFVIALVQLLFCFFAPHCSLYPGIRYFWLAILRLWYFLVTLLRQAFDACSGVRFLRFLWCHSDGIMEQAGETGSPAYEKYITMN